VVRTAYAKLSYAVDLNTAYRLLQANPEIVFAANPKIDAQQLANRQLTLTQELAKQTTLQGLRFRLSGLMCGSLADVAEKKYADVFPPYDGDGHEVIHTAVETDNYNETGGAVATMETATAKWGPAATGRMPDWTVSQMIPVVEREMGVSSLLRYCSFTVTATLAGRSRTYKAAFLFGEDDQAAAADPVAGTDGNNLGYFLQHPVYPGILLQTRMGDSPVVRDFLAASQRSGASCKPGEACCDTETMQCGVFSADLLGRRP
jgi:hypothetical protein